jgi:hypothetical protein
MHMTEPAPMLRQRPREIDVSATPTMSDEFFTMLVEANRQLITLPPNVVDCPEVRDLGLAIRAGKTGARHIIEQSGGVAVARKLMEASSVFRSTGHFRQCSLLERCAFAIAGWERRRNPRRR